MGAFTNYLSTIPGINGIPLSYVIRETEEADRTITYPSFNERAIASAPLVGPNFQADARKVHQFIKSYLQTEAAEQWIKPLARLQSGHEDMIALRNHYSGEGNTSRRIAQAERYRDTLYYKHEKPLSFSTFLDNIQKMFNMFKEEGERITEQAKVRMLLKTKVLHSAQLQDAVSALRIRAQLTRQPLSNAPTAYPRLGRNYQITRSTGRCPLLKHKSKRIRRGGTGGGLAAKRKGIHMPARR